MDGQKQDVWIEERNPRKMHSRRKWHFGKNIGGIKKRGRRIASSRTAWATTQ
jgi:hypothetical protein